jgi:hypothetical protein
MKRLITGILFVVYIQLNMFRASLCPSSGAYQLQQQPQVYRWSVVAAVLLAVVVPTTANSTATTTFLSKPEVASAVDRLLIMGVRMPETC